MICKLIIDLLFLLLTVYYRFPPDIIWIKCLEERHFDQSYLRRYNWREKSVFSSVNGHIIFVNVIPNVLSFFSRQNSKVYKPTK